jgi:aspartate carbamoyltransferase
MQSFPCLTNDPSTWLGSSLLSVQQITADGLQLLFDETVRIRELVRTKGGDDRLKNTILATVFFEASTRTACSFQAASLRLGAKYIHVDGEGGNSSAAKKGESVEDTCRCLECYADVVVLRHPVQGTVERVISVASKPVINAGDGIGEHPTQALLDIFTIYDELKLHSRNSREPLTIVLLGDLKHGRTVHSLAKLLCTCNIWAGKLTIRYCAPAGLAMPAYVTDYCDTFADSVAQESYDDLQAACQGANVLYVTRIQRERFHSDEEYEAVKVSAYSIMKN